MQNNFNIHVGLNFKVQYNRWWSIILSFWAISGLKQSFNVLCIFQYINGFSANILIGRIVTIEYSWTHLVFPNCHSYYCVEIKERDKNWLYCMRLSFVNFDLGGYLLKNGIAGLIIEAEKWIDYCYLGNWTSFKMMCISLMYDFGLLRNLKFKWWKLSFVG